MVAFADASTAVAMGVIAGIVGVITGIAGVIAIAGVAIVLTIGIGPVVGRGSSAVGATTTWALPWPRQRGGMLGMVKIRQHDLVFIFIEY